MNVILKYADEKSDDPLLSKLSVIYFLNDSNGLVTTLPLL